MRVHRQRMPADRNRTIIAAKFVITGNNRPVVVAMRRIQPDSLFAGGDPKRFTPYAELYRRALNELKQSAQPLGVHSPGYVADTDEQARKTLKTAGGTAHHNYTGVMAANTAMWS